MADYYSVFKTNDFFVTDENLYKNIINGITCNDFNKEFYPQQENQTGNIKHAFGGYGDISYYPIASQSDIITERLNNKEPLFSQDGVEIEPKDIDGYNEIYDADKNMIWNRFHDDAVDDIDMLCEALQWVLDDESYIAIHTISHEKLRDVHSEIVVITNEEFTFKTSQQFLNALETQQMLHNHTKYKLDK